MQTDAVRSGSPWSKELVRELADEEFRHEYMMDQVRSYIAFQIRALREQRRWSQGDLANKADKTQSVISRLEDPDYGKLSLQSCLEIAGAYDLPLLVQFVEWDDWLSRMSNVSPSALRKRSFDADRLLEKHHRSDQSAASANNSTGESTALQNSGLGSAASAIATANANASISRHHYIPAAALLGLIQGTKASAAEGVPA
jgi:transcriptional regulator with XRE-family HTH domain